MTHELLAIRRYPVKSMGGEGLASADFDPRGMVGDRWYAVVDEEGHFACGKSSRRFRRHDGVFGYHAATGPEAVTVVTGGGGSWPAGSAALDDELTSVLGVAMRVRPEGDVPHQDAGSVSLVGGATLRWCAERFGVDADPRRLRANLVVATEEPFVEESWVGRTLAVGSTRLQVVERIERCRTIDLAQDGVASPARWLKPLGAERDTCLAVYADVARPGTLAVGDMLTVD